MKAHKLTDENSCTRGKTQWGEGVSHTATGEGKKLCSDGWIHFYTDPLIAVLMNPSHTSFQSPILWECETSGEHLHEPLKSGCKKLTTIRQIPLPEVTTNQKIAFGILCAKEVCKDVKWNRWADNWLSNVDRSIAAADAIAAAAAAYAAAAYAVAAYAVVYAIDAVDADAAAAVDVADAINFAAIAKKALTFVSNREILIVE